jgi:hypothetical protein
MMALAVFSATALADFAWTSYIAAVAGNHRAAACMWSALIVTFGAVMTVALVRSRWHVVPAALGAAVGTYLSMSW